MKTTSTKAQLVKLYKESEENLEQFWEMWYNHKLLNLHARNQTTLPQTNIGTQQKPNIKDIVLIHDSKLPWARWRIGWIQQILKSHEGVGR